jgi:hypothetical protein
LYDVYDMCSSAPTPRRRISWRAVVVYARSFSRYIEQDKNVQLELQERKRYACFRQQEQLFLEHKTMLGVIACNPYLGTYR